MGRWLTDVTHLMPLLLPGQQCRFALEAASWAGPWQPTLSLRYSRSSTAATAGTSNGAVMQAKLPQLLELPFNGGNFDATYNDVPAFKFTTPPAVRRAVITATITGAACRGGGTVAVAAMCLFSQCSRNSPSPHAALA